METDRFPGSFEEMGAVFREQVAKYPELGTFEERRERHFGADDLGTVIPAKSDEIRKMRREGNKQAGRRGVEIMADDINSQWLMNTIPKLSLDRIYEILSGRTEYTYLDFLDRNFPQILEEIKAKYGIPPVKRSRHIDIFAEEDEPHLIDTISRLRSFEVYTIYLKDRESDAMISFLERNFPHILIEIKAKHEIPMMASSS